MERIARIGVVLLGIASSFAVAARPSPAQDDAGRAFDEGARSYRAGDMARAAQWFLRAARAGHARAQLQIGWHFETGTGVDRDLGAAAEWYEASARQGVGQAMSNLGWLHENGAGVAEDWVAAARWYHRGAEAGNDQAAKRLADAYRFGVGVPQDRRAAIEWYLRAAALGCDSSADQARWLRDATNCAGFFDDGERALVMGGALGFEPHLLGDMGSAGLVFRDSAERRRWARRLRAEIDAWDRDYFRRQEEEDRKREEEERRRRGW